MTPAEQTARTLKRRAAARRIRQQNEESKGKK
jgi:hypothetical protein